MEKVLLRFLNTDQIKSRIDSVLAVLTDGEKLRAERFRREADRLLYMGGIYLVKSVFGKDALILRSRTGKPFTDGGMFNISHSVDTVGAAFCAARAVGLDIEKHREGYGDIRGFCLSADEAGSGHCFFDLFTAKESLAKAEGGGLPADPASLPALPLDGEVEFKGKKYVRHRFYKKGYSVSVCLEGEDFVFEEETAYEN